MTDQDDEAADGKRQAEVSLYNLRRIGVVPEGTPVDKVAELLSALAGIGKAVKAMPAATTQQAMDHALMIERAFLALAHEGGGRVALEAVKPVLEVYRRNLKKRHVTDYGRLKHIELAIQHMEDPDKAAEILRDYLDKLSKLQAATTGRVM